MEAVVVEPEVVGDLVDDGDPHLLLDMADTVEDLEEEVRITVVHEVAHHFGLDDGRLHELGWG